MKEKNKIIIMLLALFMVFVNKGRAQIEVMANYVFSQDSVAGFDEAAASAGALAGSFYGREYKVFMYRAKRDYIKQKYHLKPAPVKPTVTLFQNDLTWASRTTTVGGACNNEDFELATTQITPPGAVQGWVLQSGSNANSCNPPQINGASLYTVYTAPTIDTKIGQVASYFDAATATSPAGNCFIRLNDDLAGAKAVKLSKSFIVTPTNALFEYAYLPVIQDGGHACCDQAGFNIHITVTNTVSNTSTVLACPQISIAVPSALCSFTPPVGSPSFVPVPSGGGWSYHPWAASAIDLTPYLGNQITLDVVVVDCNAGGHGGYSYFDARCAPMDIVGNGNSFPAGTPSVTLPTCGALSSTICAPPGTGPYSWNGPGVVAPYNVPSTSNQCFTTNISADFTLTMNPPGSCQPINRVITVTITAAPFILANVLQPSCSSSMATVSYTAAGSASVNPTVTWSPAPTATTQSATNLGTATFPAGTGVVSVTAIDPLGCKVSATVNINQAPVQPTISILNVTGSPSITCNTPSVVLAGTTSYTNGSLNWYWASNSFTASTQSITVTNAATLITLTATDPVTGCVATATSAVRVNTAVPVGTVTPVNQNIPCGPGIVATATASAINPSINVTHCWYAPGVSVPNCSGGPVFIFTPGVGTNTYVLTNDINGCTTTSYVTVVSSGGNYPTINVTSPQNFTLGCSSKTVASITMQGQVPGGGAVSYTLLAPAFTGTNYGVGTTNVYTVTTPGTYTMIVKNNANACETRIPLPIIQNINPPDIGYTVSSQTLSCDVPSLNIVGTSTTSGASYNWAFNSSPGNTPAYTVTVRTNTAGASVPSATVIDTYSLTVTDPNNLCTSRTTVKMYQNTRPPIPIISGAIPLNCQTFSVNLTNSSQSGILAATFFTTQAIAGYSWTGPPPQQPDTSTSSYQAYTPGTYTLIAKDLNNGCMSQTTAVVGDNRNYPVIQTPSVVPLDCGAANGVGVKLPATVLGIPANGVTAAWTTPVPTPSVSGLTTLTLTTDGIGEYKLTVMTNSNFCVSQAFVEVVPGILNGGFTADKTTGFAPLTVNFSNTSASSNTASSTSSITSVWSFGNGTTKTTTNTAGTSAVYNQPGTYTVTMFVRKGSCLDTSSTVIVVDIPSKLEVPNVFTPNGDNSNDIFFLKTANLTDITAVIYDRWGNKIYELTTDKGNIAWDGKNQEGKEVPDGTYFYVIKATGKDGQAYDTKGNVSLYR